MSPLAYNITNLVSLALVMTGFYFHAGFEISLIAGGMQIFVVNILTLILATRHN